MICLKIWHVRPPQHVLFPLILSPVFWGSKKCKRNEPAEIWPQQSVEIPALSVSPNNGTPLVGALVSLVTPVPGNGEANQQAVAKSVLGAAGGAARAGEAQEQPHRVSKRRAHLSEGTRFVRPVVGLGLLHRVDCLAYPLTHNPIPTLACQHCPPPSSLIPQTDVLFSSVFKIPGSRFRHRSQVPRLGGHRKLEKMGALSTDAGDGARGGGAAAPPGVTSGPALVRGAENAQSFTKGYSGDVEPFFGLKREANA